MARLLATPESWWWLRECLPICLTIAILPDFRGQGLAQQMLAELENWAKAKGATEVILEVDTKNESAIRLYNFARYEEISTRANYYGLGIDALIMRKELK